MEFLVAYCISCKSFSSSVVMGICGEYTGYRWGPCGQNFGNIWGTHGTDSYQQSIEEIKTSLCISILPKIFQEQQFILSYRGSLKHITEKTRAPVVEEERIRRQTDTTQTQTGGDLGPRENIEYCHLPHRIERQSYPPHVKHHTLAKDFILIFQPYLINFHKLKLYNVFLYEFKIFRLKIQIRKCQLP